MKRQFVLWSSLLIAALSLHGQAVDKGHDSHAAVNERGDHVMGFSHEKTTHHFRMYPNGGAIEVSANDAKDTASRDQIQTHLSHIAQMFTDGNFKAPMLVHDQVPPGVPILQRLKTAITYRFEKTDRGGSIQITTANAEALQALYEFLRFQITDHKTGDPQTVSNPR
jgi:hypothetical protein